ncbi:MAG: hypothetical protein O9286_07860 [Aquidulcibacter sp.]|jgi:predicted exporter|uniref:DUF6992 family protein n=1 Tax=Aquidulcibacter sp. TaxID=2052990 RepID=UPI0022C639CE|nr:hypothetical protein [Aquidulcibacter sp.]MCA3697049.1 hypothetical protein [Aquidulcibacter sp.]MCZ8282145.1 hypothetical protein [Aquidulcibacter sp.]
MTPEDLLANFRVTILLWWGLANIALSVAALLVARRFWRGAFVVNLIWNVFTLVTWAAIQLGFAGPTGALQANEAMLLLLCASIGLDVAMYSLCGAWLLVTARSRRSELWKGAAYSFWFQGIIHLTNSFLWLADWLALRDGVPSQS